jgi:hypothetical protein
MPFRPPWRPLSDANWTPDFWLSGAELRVKKPFLVRRAAGRKSGDVLVCVCVWI